MVLDVSAALSAQGEEIPFVCAEEVRATTWDGAEVEFLSPVEARGVFVAMKDDVWVKAEVRARICTSCANCLGAATLEVCAPVEAHFAREPDPEDPDLFPLTGRTVRLNDAALGALWMRLPMRILCKPDCRGLCPVCGADLNIVKCACQKESPSKHPFSALASLLKSDEEV